MLMHCPTSLRVGWPTERRVACMAKTKKAGSRPTGKGFGSAVQTSPVPQKQRGTELRILDDLPPVLVEPESEIDESTFDSCLFFMNKTEELCGRLPKLLDHAWNQATAQRADDCVSRPVFLASSPDHTTALHILSVKHDDCYNPALIAAVWDRVRPDAVALDVQPLYPKSFTRMAKAMDGQLLDKLLTGPLTSLSGALDRADDVDRLRWHHAILQVVGQGASPILVTKADLFNVFANRDLHLSEAIAVAHLAARGTPPDAQASAGGGGAGGGGSGGSPIPIHGIDVEDASLLQALGDDEYWTEGDSAAYKQLLLKAADPQLRSAVNTWLQGIPVGTSTTVPRQRFILSRLEQALNRQQLEAHTLAHAAYRSAHAEPRVREQLQLQEGRGAHLLRRVRDIASGRLGGRRCARMLAVMNSEDAVRLRRLAEVEATGGEAASGSESGGGGR